MRILRLRTLVVLVVQLAIAYVGVSWIFSDGPIAPQDRPLGKVGPTAYGLPKPDHVLVPGDAVKLASWYLARVQADKQFGAWARIFVPGALFIARQRGGFDAGNAAPASEIRQVRAPVLLIHSRQDGFTPVDHSEAMYAYSNKARTRLAIAPGTAQHAMSYTQNPIAYTADVDRLLREFKLSSGIGRAR